MKQKHNANTDPKENVMRPEKRGLATIGLAGVLAVLAGEALVARGANADVTYKAELSPLNERTTGSKSSGEATFTISGGRLTIRVTAKSVPPNMEHLQHFHEFAKGDRGSRCPTVRDDANGDGIIDMVETEPVAGTTMAPFDADPIGWLLFVREDRFLEGSGSGIYREIS
jgi:hypothetical protein